MTLIAFQFTNESWWFQYLDDSETIQEITFNSISDARDFSNTHNFGLNFDGCPI
jgi:hypothetical protein